MSSSRPSSFALTSPGKLKLYSTAELITLPHPRWLIKGIMPMGALVGLYGEPGSGKSFITCGMAMCVASGTPWLGHAIDDSEEHSSLYISAEGGSGIGKRAMAWLIHQGKGPEAVSRMAWLTEAIPITQTSDDIDLLFRRLDDEAKIVPSLVVIDTLARTLEGNENETEDMGNFIKGIDKIRNNYRATVIIVHHTRLDASRERGNTAFRGAADTMLFVQKRKEGLMLLNNKQKDHEEFAEIPLAFHIVPTPSEDTPDDTSAVIISSNSVGRGSKVDAEELIMSSLQDSPHKFSELESRGLKAQVSKATLKRALLSLVEKGKIIKEYGLWQLSS